MSESYVDPFITAAKYVFTKLAKYVSFYAVVGNKYIELKNTRASFSKNSVMVFGDLDVEEGGIFNRLLINVYDKDNNLIASEDVRFEYEIQPGKYRIAFVININKPFVSTKEPACEFLALPGPYVVVHPELKYPILYAGLHRAYDFEATYLNLQTVSATYLIATSNIPLHAGASYTRYKYFTGRLGQFRTSEAGITNPTFYSYYPQLHSRIVTPVSGVNYMVRISDFVAGIGAISGDEVNFNLAYASPASSYGYIQLPNDVQPGLYNIFISTPSIERGWFENLTYNIGRCTLGLSIVNIDQLWMFGGAEMRLNGDAGAVNYKLPSLAMLYLVDPYDKDLCDIVNHTARGLIFCNAVSIFDDYKFSYRVNELINRVINDPISFDRFKDHPCVSFWLSQVKQGKRVDLYSAFLSTGVSINKYPPWIKYAYVMQSLKDVRNHSYTIYVALYTAGLTKARLYFKGDVEISYLDLPPGTRPSMPLMYDGYWYGAEVKRYIGATSYSIRDVDYLGFEIPKTHYDIFFAIINYKPVALSKTDLKNILDPYFPTKQPQCFHADPAYDPNWLACYYDCLEDDAVKITYHKVRPFEEVFIFTLEDDEGYSYIPTVHGAIKFMNPFKYRQQVIENATEPLPDYIVKAPLYVWLVWSIYHGQFVSRDEPNTPYIVTNPAYEYVLRLPENRPP